MINIRLFVLLAGFGALSYLCNGQVSTLRTLPTVGPEIPQRVLKKIDSLFPNHQVIPEDKSSLSDFSFGTGEPIEHGLPADYFKGKTFYNYDYSNDNDTNYNIYLDSAGNIMLKEIYVGIDSSNLPLKIRDYLYTHFGKYMLGHYSLEQYSSLDSDWWYDIIVNFANNTKEGHLYFDSYANLVNSDFPELPGSVGIRFNQKFPNAINIVWDSDAGVYLDSVLCPYLIYFTDGVAHFKVWCNSTGTTWSEPKYIGANVPNNILDKFNSVFPDIDGKWFIEKDFTYRVDFFDIRDTTTNGESYMTMDSLANILIINRSINYDSVPSMVKAYIESHYPSFIKNSTCIMTNNRNIRSYVVEVRDPKCINGNCSYLLYFNKSGEYLKKEPFKVIYEKM